MCNGQRPLRGLSLGLNVGSEDLPKTVISIVDDDESIREAMTSLMKSLGFVADAFHSGESFLRSDRRHGTACLIADVRMPGMTGFELHSRLVASGKPIPTILITAHPDETMRARALKAGVVGYLAKPFDEDHLLACLRAALEQREADDSGS
jgi:FixJ family two-component response regulator